MANRIEMNRTRFRLLSVGLAALIGLGAAVSCSSGEQVSGVVLVEYPGEQGPKAPPPPSLASSRASAPATKVRSPSLAPPPASAAETPAPSMDSPRSPSEDFERRWGIKLSPLDKIVMDDCPKRAWSQNVPNRRCMHDNECGDGFCDRDHCAPLWSCRQDYSRPCERDEQCAGYLCIDGRCRSCISDEECAHTASWQSDPKCESVDKIPNARECFGVVGGGGP